MDRDQTHTHDTPDDGEATTSTTQVAADRDGDMMVASSQHDADDAHLTRAEVARVRSVLDDGSFDDDTSRMKWFLLGFLFALLAIAVAAVVFLAISDEDNDGELELEVPTLDVDVGG